MEFYFKKGLKGAQILKFQIFGSNVEFLLFFSILMQFLAHLAKGKVSFCHHLASIVRRLSSVNFSHFNLLL
jgi:hypothetical protein